MPLDTLSVGRQVTVQTRFFRFHPITGEDANDIDTRSLTEEQRVELAKMVNAGAKFYWEKDDNPTDGLTVHGYVRIERLNVCFVLEMLGITPIFVDKKVN